MNHNKQKILSKKRQFSGVVIKDAMSKTVIVKVERWKTIAKYNKRISLNRKFKCHDEKGQYHVGDRVIFEECRPLSREKRWRVIKKIK